ncbi:MAG: putative membrane protein (Fun14 family) [Chlamydiales bacterium]|jgi:uncharacterized membrane protein (Fun14 family)
MPAVLSCRAIRLSVCPCRVESIVKHEVNGPPASKPGDARGFPVWKRTLLVLAAASVSLGFALRHYESSGAPVESSGASGVESASIADSSRPASDVTPAPMLLSVTELSASGVEGSQVAPELMGFSGTSSFGPTPARGDSTVAEPRSSPAPVAGTVAVAAPSSEPSEPSPTPWSPLFLKGGLSIFVGLCVGHAIRAFLKLSMIGLGVVFLGMLGLQYSGLLDIDWQAAEGVYDHLASRVAGEIENVRAFIAGSLPSAGLGTVGLIAGFKRSR